MSKTTYKVRSLVLKVQVHSSSRYTIAYTGPTHPVGRGGGDINLWLTNVSHKLHANERKWAEMVIRVPLHPP